MRQRLLALVCGAVVVGCSEQPTERSDLGRLGATRDRIVPSPINPTDTSELVALPNGLYHRSCVRAVPNGGRVNPGGVVTTPTGEVVQYPPCVSPGPVRRGAPEVANSPWPHGPNSWTAPTVNGYIERGTASIGGGHVFRQIKADWTAPPKPISYSSGNIIFLFPGLSNNTGTTGGSILQPVLQLGNNGYWNPGNNWIGALYVCQGPSDPCYYSNLALTISPGHSLSGLVYASNCSGSVCDWTVSMSNNTTLTTINMTLTGSHTPQTNDTYTDAHGGALETYSISTCDQLPAGGISFSNIQLLNELGSAVTPSFAHLVESVTPQCGYAVSTTSSSVFLADSATTAVRGSISGPTSVQSGTSATWYAVVAASPHTGTPPYTYTWGGVVFGSGSSVTGVPSGSGPLYLTIRDANGVEYATYLDITVCDGTPTC